MREYPFTTACRPILEMRLNNPTSAPLWFSTSYETLNIVSLDVMPTSSAKPLISIPPRSEIGGLKCGTSTCEIVIVALRDVEVVPEAVLAGVGIRVGARANGLRVLQGSGTDRQRDAAAQGAIPRSRASGRAQVRLHVALEWRRGYDGGIIGPMSASTVRERLL